jgi:hypothetical protein
MIILWEAWEASPKTFEFSLSEYLWGKPPMPLIASLNENK